MSADWTTAAVQILAAASLRVTFVAALVAGILLVSRVRATSFRHAAWTAVLGAMLLMPALPSVVPAVSVAVPSLRPLPASEPVVEIPEAPAEARDGIPALEVTPLAGAAEASLTERRAEPSARTIQWSAILVVIYAVGVLVSLVAMCLGWRALRLLERASRPLDLAPFQSAGAGVPIGRLTVCESRAVAAPVALGILNPRIVLPPTWRVWSATKLRAVVAHEASHVRRRDTLIAALAQVNRAVFWFHPLAWWLERRLQSMAEFACDAAAVREVGEIRQYAAVLVDMADDVRLSGRRVAWTSIGVSGSGDIGRRVERLLRGEIFPEVSMARKLVVGFSCAVAIFIVIACRPQAPPPTPPPALQADPEVSADLERQKAETAFFKAAVSMTGQQVSELEAALKTNPENLDALRRLQVFYRFSASKVIGWDKTVAARRRHILWLIERHPGDVVTTEWGPIDPKYDPDGYATAKKLWLTEIGRPGVEAAVLSNAAYFFVNSDKPLAEECLLRAQALEPGGPNPRERDGSYFPSWSTRLGWLYAGGVIGSIDQFHFAAHAVSAEQSRGGFALAARIKLAESKDVAMLIAAGRTLTMMTGARSTASLDFDPVALGRFYLERAQQLDPKAPNSRTLLAGLEFAERLRRIHGLLAGAAGERVEESLVRLSNSDRLAYLAFLVESEYTRAEFLEFSQRDEARMNAGFARARKLAQDLFELATKSPNDPDCGARLFSAHVVLACFSLRDGDKPTALRHMKDAVNAPSSESLRYRETAGLWPELAGRMLGWGERDSVIQFLEQYARLSLDSRDRLLKEAAAIRAGRMPAFYQRLVTPR